MSITSKIYPSEKLVSITATGKISLSQIVETIESFHKQEACYNVLWDFRYADLDALIFSNELGNIAISFFKTNRNFQKIGKTAIVASTNLWFSIAKIYAKFAKVKRPSHIIQIFRFKNEATKWLDSEK